MSARRRSTNHNLLLRQLKKSKGVSFVPGFSHGMFEDKKRPKKCSDSDGGGTWKVNAWDCLAVAYMDQRTIVGITFEAEYHEHVIGKLLVWNRTPSR